MAARDPDEDNERKRVHVARCISRWRLPDFAMLAVFPSIAISLLLVPACSSPRVNRVEMKASMRVRRIEMKASKRVLASLPFDQARAMARAMGMASKEEWDEYSCPGAYRLPSDPDNVWVNEWRGWDDWLGVMLPFDVARIQVRKLGLQSQAEFEAVKRESELMEKADPDAWNGSHALRLRDGGVVASDVDLGRLPIKPDLVYAQQWAGWDDFLGPRDPR